MLLKRLGSRLEQSTYSWLFPSWSKPVVTSSVVGALFLLLAVVGFAGCFGIMHYRDYMWLKAENAYLHQKETELDKLQLTLRSIRKDEDTIRNFLGTGVHRWNSEHLTSGCGKILVLIEIWVETQPIHG